MLKFNHLFIANRGEIARRIATTAKRLGLRTTAICEEGRPPAYLLDVVDHFCIVKEEAPALYLDAAQMITLAQQAGCDALHPGFGFLSENHEFAAAVQEAGLTWIGPHPKAIATMASKGAARVCAEKAAVPLIPGLEDCPVPDDIKGDFSTLEKFVADYDLPVLIKAAYGGGGKGMRLVHAQSELKEAALRAKSEGLHSFGSGQLVVERYLAQSRHVEVQIMGDQQGGAYALGDRDCSIQRRHQKILEEAPAPDLPEATRKAMHTAAVSLAQAVGYDNAGTVEFLVDWSETSRQSDEPGFYFLEMNTRLQVEHPVTEEVFGVDLVEWQLRVASGQALPAQWAELKPRGHSIEARLYAEDPEQNYLPAPGPVASFVPAQGPGVRWESGLDQAGEITGRFDPMIAKLVVTGSDREAAMSRMIQALRGTFFAGPPNNLRLIREILTASPFREQAVATNFLDLHQDEIQSQIQKAREPLADQAESLLDRSLQTGWGRLAGSQPPSIKVVTERSFGSAGSPSSQRGDFTPAQNLTSQPASLSGLCPTSGCGLLPGPDGSEHAIWYAGLQTADKRLAWVRIHGETFSRAQAIEGAGFEGQAGGASDQISAPVPGKVIAVNIAAGTTVDAGQALVILESMKMEFEVKAARAGTIGSVLIKVGDQVEAAAELATWQSESE